MQNWNISKIRLAFQSERKSRGSRQSMIQLLTPSEMITKLNEKLNTRRGGKIKTEY